MCIRDRYRGIERPVMSLILTVLSLGTRVALAYLFAPMPQFGVSAIWWAIPVGWILADLAGFLYYKRIRNRLGAQPVSYTHLDVISCDKLRGGANIH